MQRTIQLRVGQRSRPGVLVGHAVKVGVVAEASANLYVRRSSGIKAEIVVLGATKGGIQIVHPVLGAASTLGVNRVAILEVADLVRERDVVRVGCPRHTRVLAGGGVDRVKVGGKVVRARIAVVSVRIEQNFTEPVGGARCHGAGLAGG